MAPDKVREPLPSLNSDPSVGPPLPLRIPDRVELLPPPTYNELEAPFILPDREMLPEVAPILVPEPRVIGPCHAAALVDELIRAPPPEPIPFNDNASVVPRLNPFKSSIPRLLTVVPASVVPKGVFVAFPADPSLHVAFALILVDPV